MPSKTFLVIVAVLLANAALAQEPVSPAFDPTRMFESSLAAAGLREADVAHLVGDMAEARFSAMQFAQIDRQFQQAQGEREAQQAMIGKVREGLAKQVGPEAIVSAVTHVRERYMHALQMATSLAKEKPEALERRFAEAMSSGLKPQDADIIAHALQERMQRDPSAQQGLLNQTMVTSRDMVRMGVSSTLTTEVVLEALAQNYNAASMELLRSTFDARKNRDNMNVVARQLGTAIQQGIEAKELGSNLGKAEGKEARSSRNEGIGGNDGRGGTGSGGGGNGGSGSGEGGSGAGDNGGSGGSGEGGSGGGEGGSGGGGR